jgi:ABC-type dipeptide/oligopeptide/nickel transport system ATPase component
MPLIEVRNLPTRFHTRNGVVHAVENVSFTVDPGQTLGIVGESGSERRIHSDPYDLAVGSGMSGDRVK